jgi:ethanolamine utilization cobalamin adenosyltransferase
MAFITEAELREKWKSGAAQFDFPKDTRFSPAALDFIKTWQLDVRVGGERLTVFGAHLHHYSEDLAPNSLGRATERKEK